MTAVILIAVGFLFLWLTVVLPQRRAQRAKLEMQDTLDVGDEIVTAGGLYGVIRNVVDEDELHVEIAPDLTVRIARRAIAARLDEDDEEELEGDDEPPRAAAGESPAS